jgi:hypothetical protein
VGSRVFVEQVKTLLGFRAKRGGEVIGGNEGYPLREGLALYKALFGAENDGIGLKNTYFLGVNNDDFVKRQNSWNSSFLYVESQVSLGWGHN